MATRLRRRPPTSVRGQGASGSGQRQGSRRHAYRPDCAV